MRRLLFVFTIALAVAPTASAWTWPADGPVLQPFSFDRTQPYAAGQHRGLDIGASSGASVRAPAAGAVTFAGSVPTSGKSVTIETADGYDVTLTHLGSITVQKGATVAEGDGVGTIGPSGDPEVSEPYVHLGIRIDSDDQGYLDPAGFLPARTPTSVAPVSPAANDPLPPVVVAAAGLAAPIVPPGQIVPPAAAPDPAGPEPASAASPDAQAVSEPVPSGPTPVAASTTDRGNAAPTMRAETTTTPIRAAHAIRAKLASLVLPAAPVARTSPSRPAPVSEPQREPVALTPRAVPSQVLLSRPRPRLRPEVVVAPETVVTAFTDQRDPVVSYRTSIVHRGGSHPFLGWALAVSAALAFVVALGLGRLRDGLTRTPAPIMEGDALLRDHPDLLRELDAAHR